jgi:Aspartyl protease
MEIKNIEEAFIKEGFVSIPFTFNGVGHPMIKATIANNVEINLLLDTGASINLLDYEFAKELNLNLTLTEGKGGGAGGLMFDIFSLDNISLEISGQHFQFDSFFSMDLSSMKEALAGTGASEEIKGILGFGFFQMTKCFIDYSGSRIFILNN